MASAIRRTVTEAEPRVLMIDFRPLRDLLGVALAQPRLNALLLAAFAGTALLLAIVGLYAITASAVRQRTHELGVRLAVGATAHDVLRLVMAEALSVVAAGLAVGIGVALFTSRLVRSMLYGVSPSDPMTLLSVCVVLLVAALVTAYFPARRAARLDAVRALGG